MTATGRGGWRPAATLSTLRVRADLLDRARRFFARRDVLEVDTPVLSRAAVSDPHIASLCTTVTGDAGRLRYLHTSPEYPMKRLLAAYRSDIYQICKVFRDAEVGRCHNPEFTLVEWYRIGFDTHRLMNDVAELLAELLAGYRPLGPPERLSYREASLARAGIDPFRDDLGRIRRRIRESGVALPEALGVERGLWLDLLWATCVAPGLGAGQVTFVHDFPPELAALARIRRGDPDVAERFEAYLDGMELANGFHELADAAEQRARFVAELAARRRAGKSAAPLDERLLAALEAGLPDCSGVALGFDRVAMLAAGARGIDDVLSFGFDHA
ncbi:MAG TPA: EF-P lysine aminoacylase EpmA [Gammaproteobacteria bacterium]|nr:EF-P lysine aminoacylase EpmA [Gammaproteobacteria bacterium]